MDRISVDRIRRVTFPTARNGYNRRAVERFLDALADWLETGRGDPARSELLRNELTRISHRAAGMIAEAEESARRVRDEARRDAERIIQRAHENADRIRTAAQSSTPTRSRTPAESAVRLPVDTQPR